MRAANNATIDSTGSTFAGGEYAMVTADEGTTPPAPLVTGNMYWVQRANDNSFYLATSSTLSGSPQVKLTADKTGSGNWYVTPYPWAVSFAAIPDANSEGRANFFKGTGSADTDVQLRIVRDPYYDRKVGFIPAFDLESAETKRPNHYTSDNPYYLGTINPYGTRGMAGGPEQTQWDACSANQIFTQDQISARYVRMFALLGTLFGYRYRSVTYPDRYPPLNNGTDSAGSLYRDLPAPAPTLYRLNIANPPSGNILPGVDGNDLSHLPQFFVGPVVKYREPWMLEGLLDFGMYANMDQDYSFLHTDPVNWTQSFAKPNTWKVRARRQTRNPSFGNVLRYGIVNLGSNDQAGRYDTGRLMAQTAAALHTPSGYAESSVIYDMMNDTLVTLKEVITDPNRPNLGEESGWLFKGNNNLTWHDNWQATNYTGFALAVAANWKERNPDILLPMSELVKYNCWLVKNLGPWALKQYIQNVGNTGDGKGYDLVYDHDGITTWKRMGFLSSFKLTWTAGNALITWANQSSSSMTTWYGYSLTSGDILNFNHTDNEPSTSFLGADHFPLTASRPYFIERVSDTTFYLHQFDNQANWDAEGTDPPLIPSLDYGGAHDGVFFAPHTPSVLSFPASVNLSDPDDFFLRAAAMTGACIAHGATGYDTDAYATLQAAFTAAKVGTNIQFESNTDNCINYVTDHL